MAKPEPHDPANPKRSDATSLADSGSWLPADTQAQSTVLQAEPPPEPPPRRDRSGEMAGAFVLRRLLGRGGMGEVWLGERVDADFEQRVAIKLVQQGAAEGELLRRFYTERRILSGLQHPHIARLVDGGRTTHGEPYLAMEYVEGMPLDSYVRAHGLKPAERIRLLRKVCDAVAYAQDRLIVHRDLKPANVLVGADGEPRVLDFGIAKLLSQDEDVTQLADRAFTPAYAAPEQMLGDPISTATDVYALGVILYQLLTGQLPKPKRGGSLLKPTSLERPSREISQLSPAEIEARYGAPLSPAALSRQLAGDLDWIVVTATQADPAQRYRNAAELGEELARWLAGLPLKTRSASRLYRAGKLLRQHWLVATALSLALLSMVAGSGLALMQAQRAAAEAARAEAEALQASQTRDFIVSTLNAATPLRAREGRATTVSELLIDALPRLDRELADAPRARAELRMVFASVLVGLGDAEPALAQLLQAEAEVAREHGVDSALMVDLLSTRAVLHGMRGDADAQRADGMRALEILGRLPGERTQEVLRVQTTLVKADAREGRYAEALARYSDILERRIALYGANDLRVAVDHNNLSVMLLMLERYAEAEAAGRRALALLRSDPQAPRARQAWVLNSIGAAQWGAGAFEAAIITLAESAVISEETLGASADPHAIARNLTGQALLGLGRAAEAEALWRALLASEVRDSTGVRGQAAYSLARLLAQQGRVAEAMPITRQSIEWLGRFRTESDPMLLRAQALLAWLQVASGEVEAGVAILSTVLQAVEASTLRLDDWGDVYAFAARLEGARGRPEVAARHRAEAERRWRLALDADNPRLATLLDTLD
jgi:serine/threonine-protein kinase